MVRYAKEHKEQTRRRILEVSSRRFKSDGVDGSGIAALMADAGLTNGAFYAHFSSKDDLIATVVAAELAPSARRRPRFLPDGSVSGSWCGNTCRSSIVIIPGRAAHQPR